MTRNPKPKALLVTALAILALAAWSTVSAQQAGGEPSPSKSSAPAPAGNETGNQTEPPKQEPGHADCPDHQPPKGGGHGHPEGVTLAMGPEYQERSVGLGGSVSFLIKVFVNASKPVTVVFKTVSSPNAGLVGSWSHNLSATQMELDGYAELKLTVWAPMVPEPSGTSYKVTVIGSVVGDEAAQGKSTAVARLR